MLNYIIHLLTCLLGWVSLRQTNKQTYSLYENTKIGGSITRTSNFKRKWGDRYLISCHSGGNYA